MGYDVDTPEVGWRASCSEESQFAQFECTIWMTFYGGDDAEDYKGRPLEIGIPYSLHSYTPDNVSVLSHTGSDLLLPFMYLRYYDARSRGREQLATPRFASAMEERQWAHRLPEHPVDTPYEYYFLWDPYEGKWRSGVFLSRRQVERNKSNWPTSAPIIEIPEWAVDVSYNIITLRLPPRPQALTARSGLLFDILRIAAELRTFFFLRVYRLDNKQCRSHTVNMHACLNFPLDRLRRPAWAPNDAHCLRNQANNSSVGMAG